MTSSSTDTHLSGADSVSADRDASVPEPVAIVGIGCRFPGGASDPLRFWALLEQGVDAIREIPPERWNTRAFYDPRPGVPGKTQARWGGFVEGIDQFDPQFFGISPREATRMDPQQRLLLEVAWEALEDAGQPVERLAGTRTAVYAGISCWDYSIVQFDMRDRGFIDVHSNTGCSLSIVSNRISYLFDLHGPSVSVDTACSSALVAIHLACQSIWKEGCTHALAGGVNAMLLPDWYIGFSRLGVLSPDGRCKAFDVRANGYVRSEGAGMVLLKPLSRALADGDRVYAVIRGTAVNQDGRTPTMTVPGQQAQEALLREAYRKAGVTGRQLQYVEAHGTGTPVGDPIEARALGSVLGEGRADGQPCVIGSVKTNIGHLEAGAGIAGLIKTTLALHHRRIPANLHFTQPNPEIDFEALRLRVPLACEPWPASDGPALAGVNSFGYGGTNAHIVLQGWECQPAVSGDPAPVKTATDARPYLVPLSARSPAALRAVARTMQQFLDTCPDDVTLPEIAGNLGLRRSQHEFRLAVVAGSKAELAEQLGTFAAGQTPPGASSERVAPGHRPRIAFVCSGQGPQWWAMGRQLLDQEPVFRAVLQRCDEIIRRLGPWSLLTELTATEQHSRMANTDISQPSIFAIQVGLAALWQSWGIAPEAVIGHSVGEAAAAYLAGVYSLEDAVRVIYQRGRCMELAPLRGRMLAASITVEEAERLINGHGDRISLAAVNGPASVTLSGEFGPLEEIARELERRKVFSRFLQVQYAFHSAQMDPIRDELLASLRGIQPRPATLPFFSTVTGRRVEGPELGPEYWWHNVRQGVRFSSGVDHLLELGCDTVVELSPHPVLAGAVTECCQHRGKKVHVTASLRRNEPERILMLRSLGQLATLGAPIDWAGVCGLEPGTQPRFLRLPLYPWQRERFWYEPEVARMMRLTAPAHPLLGVTLGLPGPAWETRLDLRVFPSLTDHRVQRVAILPATAYLEMAFAAARETFGEPACQLQDIRLVNPCFPSADQGHGLLTVYLPEDAIVQVHSRPREKTADWTHHFQATLRTLPGTASEEARFDPEVVKRRCPRKFGRADCYAYFQKKGLEYGPNYQGLERGWQGDQEALGLVRLPEGLTDEAAEYLFHPALLDSCFHASIPAEREFSTIIDGLYLPVEIESIRLFRKPGPVLWSHARLTQKTQRWFVSDIDIYNEDGQPVAQVRGLRSQRVVGALVGESLDEMLYEYQWQPQPAPATTPPATPGTWLLFADQNGVGGRLADSLRAAGESCVVVRPGNRFSREAEDHYQIRPDQTGDVAELLQAVLTPERPTCRGIVHLWNLDAPSAADLATAELAAAQDAGLHSVLALVQAWDRTSSDREARLVVVTRGAQSVGESAAEVAIAQAPVVGFCRVVISEYPRLHCKLVDLDSADADASLLAELWATDDEDEIALRGSQRFVHRFLPAVLHAPTVTRPASETAYRLGTHQPGTLDALALRPLRRRQPGPGEVEVEILAAGLNFSDVMKALGIYPGLADGPIPLGIECSGRIAAIGDGVQGFRVGDEVMAVAPFAFASHVTVRADLVAPKPTRLRFEEAATIPLAFLTASYALDHLAHLSAGERVLIHSASGGVGLAAIQIARRVGAEIFATAGNPEKREFLRSLGVQHVMDSRSLAFADEVMEATGGRGVDVVLNSLAGEALIRSVATLGDYGRFLEIGKRDIYGNSRLGLRPFRKNLSFFAIDLDRMLRERPALLGTIFQRLVREVEAGELTPLPHHDYPIADAVSGFRLMQAGKHIGKVVLSMQERPTEILSDDEAPAEDEQEQNFRKDSTYLLIGGLGGFGLALGRWMAERGAGHLALMTRRGADSPDAPAAVAELEGLGAKVTLLKGDVSKEADVAAALAEIDRTLPPLRGVFHVAMVLEDALLLKLDRDLMDRVIAPKMNGAWNLHTQTRNRPLDHFVLFSSLASVFGNAGQGNYAAANAFLDHLAYYRRSLGLAGVAVNWGFLGDVGYLSQRQQLGDRLERQGVLSFTALQALTLLERILRRRSIQISVMRMDWSLWRGLGSNGPVSPRFAHLLKEAAAVTRQATGLANLDALMALEPGDRPAHLEGLMREKVARILGASPERVDRDVPLLNLGLDSLMALELRNWIESELRVNLPIVELMRSPTLASLLGQIVTQLGEPEEPAVPVATETNPETLLANLDNMSGDEVDALLATLLADQERR